MTSVSADPYFDFDRAIDVPEDIVLRTSTDDGERWVDTLHTPSGHRALWNYGGFSDAEEAIAWLKTVNAE